MRAAGCAVYDNTKILYAFFYHGDICTNVKRSNCGLNLSSLSINQGNGAKLF